jgi:hypothetical protein
MKKPASALLISILITGLLLTASLGVSFLVLRDLSTFRTVVAGTQARYAAEGMQEWGLMKINTNLAGYAPSWDGAPFSSSALGFLSSTTRGPSVPCLGGYGKLAYGDSIQLPLFAQTSEDANQVENTHDFYVEFYMGDAEGNLLPSLQTDDPVLRWKIQGFQGLGEAPAGISEFAPITPGWVASHFGPGVVAAGLGAGGSGITTANYFDTVANVNFADYPISQFLSEHSFNVLTLSHASGAAAEDFLYYRMVSTGVPLVCESVTLAADAKLEFGSARKILSTRVREGQNLEVFDWVLFNAKDESDDLL